MSEAKLPEPILVTQPAALRQAVEDLQREPILAVDTESNSLYSYREQVCLIQFSTPQTDYLIDPLALADCSLLGPIFADPGIEKVFHAAEYDLLCLKRDYGFEFSHLFDTMAAARILGREAVGLGALLETEFGVRLNKRYQRANWGQRPLPADLLSYARLDTHYLIALRDRLYTELVEKKLWPLAQEDFARQRQANGNNNGDQSPSIWRIHGASELMPQQAAVLAELCAYRERVARTQDRPVFKVINDQTLLEIARLTPSNLRELGAIPGMNEGQVRRHGMRLLEGIDRGLRAAPIFPPKQQRPDEKFLGRLEALRRWRKVTAKEMGVESDVVLPRDLVYRLAESNPQTPEELATTMGEAPWRLGHFGPQILSLLVGQGKTYRG